jgi:5'(3')-deoxyribonucleotidase
MTKKIQRMMKKTQKIGIDLDNTVADFLAVATPLLKKHYGLEPDFNRLAYKIEEIFGIDPKNRPPGMLRNLLEGDRLFRNLPPLEEGIEQLTHKIAERDVKTNIYMITARTPTDIVVEDTLYWLHNNGFIFTDVFFTDNKADLCKAAGIDVMIEDELGHIFALIKAGIRVVVRDQPWNNSRTLEYFEQKGQVKRARTWREILHATEEFLQ